MGSETLGLAVSGWPRGGHSPGRMLPTYNLLENPNLGVLGGEVLGGEEQQLVVLKQLHLRSKPNPCGCEGSPQPPGSGMQPPA